MIRISDKSDISASDVVNEVVSRPGWAQFLPGSIPAGAQGTVRIAALLRILAANNSTGMKLHEIVSAAELEQSTAHRVLSALHSVGFVARDEEAKRYHLGPLLFELFTTAFPHFNMREICRPYIERLAEELGDTAYVMVQSGYDAICADLCQGNHPIRTCTVSVGQRRPLGLGCGSLCVLAHLSDQEVSRIITHNQSRYAAYSLTGDIILERVKTVRELGYVAQEALTSSDVIGVAVPILGKTGYPLGSLSMTALRSRMTEERIETLRNALDNATRQIRDHIVDMGYV